MAERSPPRSPSAGEEAEEELKYYYGTLGAEVPLERLAALAKAAGPSSNPARTPRASAAFRTTRAGGGRVCTGIWRSRC